MKMLFIHFLSTQHPDLRITDTRRKWVADVVAEQGQGPEQRMYSIVLVPD